MRLNPEIKEARRQIRLILRHPKVQAAVKQIVADTKRAERRRAARIVKKWKDARTLLFNCKFFDGAITEILGHPTRRKV